MPGESQERAPCRTSLNCQARRKKTAFLLPHRHAHQDELTPQTARRQAGRHRLYGGWCCPAPTRHHCIKQPNNVTTMETTQMPVFSARQQWIADRQHVKTVSAAHAHRAIDRRRPTPFRCPSSSSFLPSPYRNLSSNKRRSTAPLCFSSRMYVKRGTHRTAGEASG